MKRLTEQSFFKYLKCPSWITREMLAGSDIREPILRKIQDEGLLEEKERALLANRELAEVDVEDIDEAAVETLSLMKEGVETIYKGVLTHGHWVGRPDVLERVEGKSDLGDWYYVAVDIKRSRHLKDEYKFQGVFYAEILGQVQGVKPVQGYVMHADGVVDRYLIEDFQEKFDVTVDALEEILEGEKEPHFLTSACKQSPWFSECEEESRACEDLSLINRVWRSEVDALEEAGFKTVSELADAKPEQLHNVRGVTMDRLYFLQQQAIALADGETIRMGEIILPEETGVALVVDVESDPLRDVDYLFGVLVTGEGEDVYHPFLARHPKDEETAWKEFVGFIEQYAGANMYHYGWYEEEVFRRMVEKYGAPDAVQQMFEENMIDILTRMREKVIFPTPFYSLKDVAKHLGFRWRSLEASGLNSILWYHDWLSASDEKMLQQILEYNEDDVRATWHVRNWAVNA